MRSTLLQPGPALVYLVMLLSLFGFWIRDALTGARERLTPAQRPAAVVTVDARADADDEPPISLDRGGGPIVVRFLDAAAADEPVDVALALDGRTMWSGVARADVGGDVSLVVRPGRLQPGLRYDLALRRESRVISGRVLSVER